MNNDKSEYGVIQTIRFMIRQAVIEAPGCAGMAGCRRNFGTYITVARIIRDTGITARY